MTKSDLIGEIDQHYYEPEVYWPLIVEFVATWLETEPEDGHRPALPTLAADWREDMA